MEILHSAWMFFQNQVLGMKWLNTLIGKGLLPWGLIGTVTPFCACSSIPIFMSFTSAGLPVGVTFSFLISSPMIDLGALVLLMSIFGAKIAVAYVILGLVIAVVGGTLLEKLGMERYVEGFVKNAVQVETDVAELTRHDRIIFSKKNLQDATPSKSEQAEILILGLGCKNCQALEGNVREALLKMGKDIAIGHITDFNQIAAYGIMSTPGLVVNGKVVFSGKVLKSDAIISILEKNL